MKFAVLAALFAAVNAADIALPFSMDELALQIAKPGKERFTLYNTQLVAKWTAEDVKASKVRSATYYSDHIAASVKWADAIVAAAGVTGQKLTDLWEELWEQRLKLDVQKRESEKLTAAIAGELVAANPELKTKLGTDADMESFTKSVADMGNKLVVAQQAKAEQATLDKAEAGIFDLTVDQQKEFDTTQLQLKQAAETKAKEQAEAAVQALVDAKAAGTYKDDGLTVAEKIAAMEKANDLRVADEAAQAKAAKAQMAELKKLGLFDGSLDADAKKALVDKQQKAAEAAASAANPTPGKAGYPCTRYEDGKDEDDKPLFKRFQCAEKFCCGTAWTATVDEDDTLVDDVSFHTAGDALKQRLEVCGLAKMDDPDGDKMDDGTPEQVDNNKFQHTIIKDNIPVQVELKFACITGAKALAAGAAAVLSAYVAM